MSLPRLTSFDPAAPLSRIFVFGGLSCVAVLTLIDRGATRAYAMPWLALLWFAQIAPPAALILRAFSRDPAPPLALPARPWTMLAGLFATANLLSALASPYRGPSLLASLTPLAGVAAFFLLYDWLARDRASRAGQLLRIAGFFFTAVAATSLVRWLGSDLIPSGAYRHFSSLIDHRNADPLGHSNYTAGLALLMLPCLATLAGRAWGWGRTGWSFAVLLALAMLFSSGSRGGLLGLAALGGFALLHARLDGKKLLAASVILAAAALALAFAHPRTRALLLTRPVPAATPNLSNVQRTAMLAAGLAQGRDRPLLGWGPGTTPLAFPRYRAQLDGGAENVLQLHSTPVQLWADLGLLGLGCGLAFLLLATRAAVSATARPPTAAAAITLAGYAVFSLTDFQFDVPLFTLALAAAAALLASPAPTSPLPSGLPAFLSAAALALIAGFGRPDPTPHLNTRALALARDPGQADAAIGLFRDSLALNPHQEIAHFNLGWLLVTRDPPAAETHFLAAARLVPDKGGVYFGLGLARLNQQPREAAATVRALALECINDPRFLTSPWWRLPSLAALRPAVTAAALRDLATVRTRLPADSAYLARELDYFTALLPWLDGRGAPGAILAAALTPARVGFFAARPAVPDFATGPVRAFHRERTGYPVLMRDLELPVPTDVFEVQESIRAADELAFLFPPKGWLPSPLLLTLLDAPPPGKPPLASSLSPPASRLSPLASRL